MNLVIVFVICSFWHGANWTFVIWGLLHGFYLVIESLTRDIREKLAAFTGINKLPTVHKLIQITTTFTAVCFGWIFFRAQTLTEAWHIFACIEYKISALFQVFQIIAPFAYRVFSN